MATIRQLAREASRATERYVQAWRDVLDHGGLLPGEPEARAIIACALANVPEGETFDPEGYAKVETLTAAREDYWSAIGEYRLETA